MKTKLIRAHLGASLTASAIATKTVQLSADGAGSAVELVLLPYLPASPFKTNPDVDSRDFTFVYDQAALIARYNGQRRKGNLNIEHNRSSGDTRSRGVVHSLTSADLEPDFGMEPGLTYAWCHPSVLGNEELAARLWLYTSAEMLGVWEDESTYRVTKATGLALTNNPATEMPMNLTGEGEDDIDAEDVPEAAGYTQEQTPADEAMLQKILEALGLTAEATEAEVLGKLAALTAAPTPSEAEQALTAAGFSVADLTAGAVVRSEQLTAVQAELAAVKPVLATAAEQLTAATSQVQTLTAELTATKAQLTELTAAATEAKLTAAVDAAIAARKATPANRDALLRQARADFAAFEDWAKTALPVINADTQTPAVVETYGLTAEQLETAKQLKVSPKTYAEAMSQVRSRSGL